MTCASLFLCINQHTKCEVSSLPIPKI